MQVSGLSVVALSLLGASGADEVITFQASQNGTNYAVIFCTNAATLVKATSATVAGTALQQWLCPVAGMQTFQAPITGGGAGSVTVKATALANVSGLSAPSLCVSEIDGAPFACPYKIKFSNGTVTDNGDGTVTVVISGGAGNSPFYVTDFTAVTSVSISHTVSGCLNKGAVIATYDNSSPPAAIYGVITVTATGDVAVDFSDVTYTGYIVIVCAR